MKPIRVTKEHYEAVKLLLNVMLETQRLFIAAQVARDESNEARHISSHGEARYDFNNLFEVTND